MTKLIAAFALAFSVLSVSAAEVPAVPEASRAADAPEVRLVRSEAGSWNPGFPISEQAALAAGDRVGTKSPSKYSCEYVPGAATVRCDFAYDVWPEMCWYGFDHVVADINLKDPTQAAVVSSGWKAD